MNTYIVKVNVFTRSGSIRKEYAYVFPRYAYSPLRTRTQYSTYKEQLNSRTAYIQLYTHTHTHTDSEAVLGVWLPTPLPTLRALPHRGALWPLAVGVEKDLGGIDF